MRASKIKGSKARIPKVVQFLAVEIEAFKQIEVLASRKADFMQRLFLRSDYAPLLRAQLVETAL